MVVQIVLPLDMMVMLVIKMMRALPREKSLSESIIENQKWSHGIQFSYSLR